MFRNKDLKDLFKKVIFFQILVFILGGLSIYIFLNKINTNIVERDFAILGNLLRLDGKVEDIVLPFFVGNDKSEDIELGGTVLKKYGYDRNLSVKNQVVLKDFNRTIYIYYSIFFLLSSMGILLIVYFNYRKFYKRIDEISIASRSVVNGDFSIVLDESGEGDIEVLNHHFNQMSNRLKNNIELLKSDKLFLKNMISDISHQIKTPLSSLIMFNDLMLSEDDMDLATRKEFLERSRLELERIQWLIVNLLKVSRIEAGAIDFKHERILIWDLLEDVIASLDFKSPNMEIEMEGDKSATFFGDYNWTKEALINIVKNGTEYGGDRMSIQIDKSPVFSTIKIRDNGSGIERSSLPYVFERFYKASNELKPNSIGIGLNLSKLIIEAQDGLVSVRSEKDSYTEFTISFLRQAY